MLRSLKRLGARYLPEWLKAPVRGRLYGYRPTAVSIPWSAEPSARAGFRSVRIRDLPPLLFPDALVPELEHHLTNQGEAVEETDAFLEQAGRGPGVLYDVGAHTGYFTWLYTAAHPGNRALAIEPSRPALAAMARIRDANGLGGRVAVRAAGAGARAGATRAWVDEHQFIQFGERENEPGYDLDLVTVDGEVERSGLVPTVLKIDVEGHEGAVLHGARETLLEHRPLVFLELHLDVLEANGPPPADVLALLEQAGYRFETLAGVPRPAAWFAGRPVAVLRLVARPR
jgi:FkbM family methyltransferase